VLFFVVLAGQQTLGIAGGQPATVFGDADRHDFILALVDGVDHGSGREQRDFMLSAAPAEQNSYPQFLHNVLVWMLRVGGVKRRAMIF
jgi:hypothetical protein